MLQDNGFRVPRRIILFSRPAEIFNCRWLFEQQEQLHDSFSHATADIHNKFADLLTATLGQLVCHMSFALGALCLLLL